MRRRSKFFFTADKNGKPIDIIMRDDLDCGFFRKKLLHRQTELIAEQENQRGERAPKELDQSRVGRLSRMDAMQQQAMSQAAARRAAMELQRIKTALDRIDSGEFGFCILCEEEISTKRLEFDPSMLMCIDCAQLNESS